jgi:histidinol-phosphatase (PHP family)
MMKSNLHTHTTFSDGKNTIEETVRAAVEKGFTAVGISDHAYTPEYRLSMKRELYDEYLSDIRIIKEKYPQISVYAGIENEYHCWQPTTGLDYVIGAVHYLPLLDGGYRGVDASVRDFTCLCCEIPDYIQRYYDTLSAMVLKHKPDIIAHFDVITKFNMDKAFFDTHSKEYIDIILAALDVIAQTDCIIEVNTGAMSRGYTTEPYPEWHLLSEVKKMGIPITLTSDSHSSDCLDFAFDKTAQRLKDMGFKSIRQLIGSSFEDIGL